MCGYKVSEELIKYPFHIEHLDVLIRVNLIFKLYKQLKAIKKTEGISDQ